MLLGAVILLSREATSGLARYTSQLPSLAVCQIYQHTHHLYHELSIHLNRRHTFYHHIQQTLHFYVPGTFAKTPTSQQTHYCLGLRDLNLVLSILLLRLNLVRILELI